MFAETQISVGRKLLWCLLISALLLKSEPGNKPHILRSMPGEHPAQESNSEKPESIAMNGMS